MNSILKNIWPPFAKPKDFAAVETSPLEKARLRNACLDPTGALNLLDTEETEDATALRTLIAENRDSYPYGILQKHGKVRTRRQLTPVGAWTSQLTKDILHIRGVTCSAAAVACITVNDRLFKIINWRRQAMTDDMTARTFSFKIRPSLLSKLPKKFSVSIGTELGPLITASGKITATIRNPVGKGGALRKLQEKSHIINKKGELSKIKTSDTKWQREVLTKYSELSGYFQVKFGYPLFITYGTLLGMRRDGEFIPHDDDFDTAYLSKHATPEEVKEEMKQIIAQMIRDGYPLQIAKSKGTFKYPVNGGPVDFFPAWTEHGRIWMQNTTSLEADRSLFLPIRKDVFKGVQVLLPHRPDEFLKKKYGPRWRVPDTGYTPFAAPGVPEYLARARMSEEEAADFVAKLTEEHPDMISQA